MKRLIRQKLKNLIPLSELREKRRKKANLDKKRYHEFYSLAATPPDQWVVMQAKKKGKLKKA